MTCKNHYQNSWEIYKAHSDLFDDDVEYYQRFCADRTTLELFAGYGRLTNRLLNSASHLECVELESKFANSIRLDRENIHICNVLNFEPRMAFERIIAGYNSFCLLTREDDVLRFFKLLSQWLLPGGLASLSYYDHRMWASSPKFSFQYKNIMLDYTPMFDLSAESNGNAVWIDSYKNLDEQIDLQYSYPVRLYKDESSLIPFIERTDLRLVDLIKDYNNENISEPGWCDFILQKSV